MVFSEPEFPRRYATKFLPKRKNARKTSGEWISDYFWTHDVFMKSSEEVINESARQGLIDVGCMKIKYTSQNYLLQIPTFTMHNYFTVI